MENSRGIPLPDETQPLSSALDAHRAPVLGSPAPPRLALGDAWKALFARKRPNYAPPHIEVSGVQDRRSEGMAVRLMNAKYNDEPIELPEDPAQAGRLFALIRVALGLEVDAIVDLALAAGGLSFATAAVVHSFGHRLSGPDAYSEVVERGELLASVEAKQGLGLARRLRQHLVGALEEERQSALGALEGLVGDSATSCSQRLLASYLFPASDDLRHKALQAARELPAGASVLMFDLRDEAELAVVAPHLDLALFPGCLVGAARLAPAGADAVVARARETYATLNKGEKRIVASLLGALPAAAPLRFLADQLPDEAAQKALAAAAGAYPARLLQHLGASAFAPDDEGQTLKSLVSLVLRRSPAALEAVPADAWPDDVCERLKILAEEVYVPPAAALEDCPLLLRRPPWSAPEEHEPAWVPKRLPKLPAWVSAVAPPVLEEGGSLPASALEALLTMVALSKDEPYGGLAAATEGLTEASLARFAKTLFEAWCQAGMPSKESWAFAQLALLGGEGCVSWLAPLLGRWASSGGAARVPLGFEILATIGSDLALVHLHGLSQRLSKKLNSLGAKKVEEISARRGLRGVALADRLVPDAGLEADGTTTLDFGPRRFVVSFDEALDPVLHDERGALLKSLPKASAEDDRDKAKAESARYRALVKTVATVAAEQVARLTSAMKRGRSWSPQEFEELMVGPPLMFTLTRRLLWGAYDEAGSVREVFTIDNTRALRGVDDAPLTLGERRVRIVKRADLDAEELAKWVEVFQGRALVQPFEQLGKELLAPPSYETLQADALKKLATLMGSGLDDLSTEQVFERWLRFAEHPFFAQAHRASRRKLFPNLDPDPSFSATKEVTLCSAAAARRARDDRDLECTGTETFFQIALVGHGDEHCFITKDLSKGVAIAHHEEIIFAEDKGAELTRCLGRVTLRGFFAMLESQDAADRAKQRKKATAKKKASKRAKARRVDPWVSELEALMSEHGKGVALLEAVVELCARRSEFHAAGVAWVEKNGLVVNKDKAGVVALQRLLAHENPEARTLAAKALVRALEAKRRAELERLLPALNQALSSEDLAVAALATYAALPRKQMYPELVANLLALVERFEANPKALDHVPGGGINMALQNIATSLMGLFEWRKDCDPLMVDIAAALLPIQNRHVRFITKGPLGVFIDKGQSGPIRDRIAALYGANIGAREG